MQAPSASREVLNKSVELKHYLQKLGSKRSPPEEYALNQYRRIALELAEDVFLLDPSFSCSISLDTMVWKTIFDDRFEHLMCNESKGNQLIAELAMAASFYKTLILLLQSHFELNLNTLGINTLQKIEVSHADMVRSNSLSIIYNALVFLGDISRYKAQALRKNIPIDSQALSLQNWDEATIWYRKAFTANPRGGRPHAQLALISAQGHNHLNTIYYYCLSLGNMESIPIVRKNFAGFLGMARDRDRKDQTGSLENEGAVTSADIKCTTQNEMINCVIELFASLISPPQASIDRLKPIVSGISQYLQTFTTSGLVINDLTVALIIMVDDLNIQFNSASIFQLI